MSTTIVLTVILALFQTVANTPESSSNVTTTHQLSSTAVDNRFNVETLVLKSNIFCNGTEREARSVQNYTIMKMGDENQWRGLLYCALCNNESIRVTINNVMPTYFIFQSCKVNFWMTPNPFEKATIDFTHPWIEYLWKLSNTCSTKSQFAVYTANKSNTSSVLNNNSSSLVVLTDWTSEAAELRLTKCGFSFNYTIKIRPNTIFNVDRDFLNAFNMIKHTYCSNGTDDDLRYRTLFL
ncbi:hypothetical protein CRE_03297 [Caenorhabditis remanei]|uniref:Uncharacterized protein n=1 Tax=Caenorhabditis remanei TaxID=31234 RepID=E3MMH8_CAERE|nr:hypothetical protein CRE_03297 [Caenorhabditis remanei]